MKFCTDSSFPKDAKIRKSSDFKEVLDKGKKLYTDSFTVICAGNSFGYSRLGLVVSKKSSKSAVKRNRIKRIAREVFRRNKDLFGSLDILVLAKKNSEALTYKKAEEEITKAFKSNFL